MHVVIAGGGTGGHVFPAIAIAEAVMEQDPRARVTFVGTPRGLEAKIVPAAGWALELLDLRPLKGRSFLERLIGGMKMITAVIKARKMLKRLQPHVVVGVGGYASAAAGVAAATLRIPLVLQEPNSIPGLTNRLLGRVAQKICITFPETADYFQKGKTVQTGNPIRRSVREGLQSMTRSATNEFLVFVCGGSQGARSLNQAMMNTLPHLKNLTRPVRVIHQVGGQADVAQIAETYRHAGVAAEVYAFIADIGRYYAEADVVVGRAGAGTLAELALIGRPALLVPYPFAADNHQEANARAFVSAGAARMILDRELDGPRLAGELRGLLEDHTTRLAMAACMKRLATPNAASDVVAEGMKLTHV